ncbi:MAG TPA: hypothetical protein VF573_29935 [Paraburkholderia sp.]|uniref:hypothetical protein n=1 Tax=Paraburkholderia sp. TaxID=1926495 RepID=UPI002ED3E376
MGEEAPVSNDMMNEWRSQCGLLPALASHLAKPEHGAAPIWAAFFFATRACHRSVTGQQRLSQFALSRNSNVFSVNNNGHATSIYLLPH